MAKNKKKAKKKEISMTPLMYMGFIMVCVTGILQAFIPAFPKMLANVLYIIGVLALAVYMMQIAFEKRTGKSEADGENIEKGIKKRK